MHNILIKYDIPYPRQEGLELNEAHQLLAFGSDVNFFGEDINIKKSKALLDASKEDNLEENGENQSKSLCLVSKMQDKLLTQRHLTDPSKMLLSSYVYMGTKPINKNWIYETLDRFQERLLPLSSESFVLPSPL
jgi:hypothetical protein